MGKMLGINNVTTAQPDITSTDLDVQNFFLLRQPFEHFVQQSGELVFRKRLDQIVQSPHLKALECMICRGCGKNENAICILLSELPRHIHSTTARHINIQKHDGKTLLLPGCKKVLSTVKFQNFSLYAPQPKLSYQPFFHQRTLGRKVIDNCYSHNSLSPSCKNSA